MDTPTVPATAPQIATAVSFTKSSRALPLSFGAVLVCFLFSFVNITCRGERVASLTGLQLAKGTEITQTGFFGSKKTQKVDAEPLATMALIAGVAGLLLSLRGRATRALTTIAGAAGAVLLLLLKSKIDGDAAKQGQGLMQVEYGPAFTIALLLFTVAALVSSGFVQRLLTVEHVEKPKRGLSSVG